MPLEPTGSGKLLGVGWAKLNDIITRLQQKPCTHNEIADEIGISRSRLTTLKKQQGEARINLILLQNIFKNFGLAPPVENVDYTPLFRDQKPRVEKRKQEGFSPPRELRCFQGREQELRTLRNCFLKGERRQCIVGLGGVGKTYLAQKYALEYRKKYKFTFWVHAETEASIRIGYAAIARGLGLVKGETPNQNKAVAGVLRWLDKNDGWLLVLDNADTPEILRGYLLPPARGHVLLTTRTRDLAEFNIPPTAPLHPLAARQGLAFFLQRCGRSEAGADERRAAIAIAKELGGLPLALEYAAAYIARKAISFVHYLELYRKQKLALLDGRHTDDAEPQHTPLRAAWEMNFAALEQDWGTKQAGAYARDLLNFCAFIGVDDIPIELVLLGAKEYCPRLYELIAPLRDEAANTKPCGTAEQAVYHDLLQPLIQYSLVTKNLEAPRFSIHRLLQAVIADRLGAAKREWQEKAVRAVDSVFPGPELENWQECERLLPHALIAAEMILTEGLTMLEAGRLLHYVSCFLTGQGRYDSAYRYGRTAVDIRRRFADAYPLDLADSFHSLGSICQYQQKHADAQKWYADALTLLRGQTPSDNQRILHVSNDQAALLNSQSLWQEAERVYTGMLDAAQNIFENDANLACFHHNLGLSYYGQARYEEAANRYHLTLKIWDAAPVKDSPHIADTWHDLAQAYHKLGRAQAEEFYIRALTMQRKVYFDGHSRTAVTLYNLGEMYKERTQYNQAERFYRDALNMDIKVSGKIHRDVAVDLAALAKLYRLMDRQADADKIQRRADAILQKLAENDPPPSA